MSDPQLKDYTPYWVKLYGENEQWQIGMHVKGGMFSLFDAEGYFTYAPGSTKYRVSIVEVGPEVSELGKPT